MGKKGVIKMFAEGGWGRSLDHISVALPMPLFGRGVKQLGYRH